MSSSLSKREINRQRWRERIDAWENSSQAQEAFCKSHHLAFASFRRWRGIFKAQDSEGVVAAPEPVRFLSVRVNDTASLNLTVLVQDDLRIEVPSGFNAHHLQQIIQVLRAT
ncbi:hypothetical protein ACFL1S_02865 [Pseudomonadota bacterium]